MSSSILSVKIFHCKHKVEKIEKLFFGNNEDSNSTCIPIVGIGMYLW